MQSKNRQLTFRMTTSTSKATLGERCCLLLVDDKKACRIMGGTQLMTRALCAWMQAEYQDRLKLYFKDDIDRLRQKREFKFLQKFLEYRVISAVQYPAVYVYEENILAIGNRKKGSKLSIMLDGIVEFDTANLVAQAIGIELRWQQSNRESETFYKAIIEPYGHISNQERESAA